MAFRRKIPKVTGVKPSSEQIMMLHPQAGFHLPHWKPLAALGRRVSCTAQQRFKCCFVTVSGRLYWFPEAWQGLQHPLHHGVLPHLRHQRHHLQEQMQLLYCCGVSGGLKEGFLDQYCSFWCLEHKGWFGSPSTVLIHSSLASPLKEWPGSEPAEIWRVLPAAGKAKICTLNCCYFLQHKFITK